MCIHVAGIVGYGLLCLGWDANVGSVTPGITALEYAQRRSKLANKLPKNAIAVLAASEVKYRASGIFNEYRQDSNFFYLTGVCGRKDRRGDIKRRD